MAKPNKNKSTPPAKAPVEAPVMPKKAVAEKAEAAVPKADGGDVAPGVDSILKMAKGREPLFLVLAVALCCLVIFRDFLTLDKVYLYKDIGSDSINIYFPWLIHFCDYVKNYGVPTWTFSQGMGQNLFPFWLGDFFSDALMFLNRNQLPYMLAFVEVIKIILAGFVFYKYLGEMKLGKFASYIGAFLYSFCGYIILGGCWTVFSVEALYVAVILFGFERWLNHNKILWFIIGIASLSFLQPFLLFPYTLFLAVYIPVRFNDNYAGQWGKFPLFLAKTLGLAVVAVAISAYQLFPDLLQYIESPRVGGEATLITRLKAAPMFGVANDVIRSSTALRAFSSDMLGTAMEYKGWMNYLESPLFYCGIFSLVTFTQAFNNLNKGQRIAYGIFLGVFAMPIIFPYFRYVFWAFTGDYYRTFSLVIVLILLIFTAKALSVISTQTSKINLITLGVTVLFLLYLLYGHSAEIDPGVNTTLRSAATFLVLVYAGLLFGLSRGGNIRKMCMVGLASVCAVEAIYFSSITVNERDVITGEDLKARVGYNDYSQDAINYVKEKDKNFFRINKDYGSGMAVHSSINDAKVQGFYGSNSYYSFNQKNYIKFLGDMDIIDPKNENATRWARGVGSRPMLMCLTTTKYWISKKNSDFLLHYGYDFISKFNDVFLYRNRYALPFGITFNKVVDEDYFLKMSPIKKDRLLLEGCVVDKGDNDLLAAFPKIDSTQFADTFNYDNACQNAIALHRDSLKITSFRENHIKGDIEVGSPQVLFFSMPFDEGWSATVNGTTTKLYRVDCGLTGLKLPAGKCSVDLVFEPRYMKQGGMVSLASLLVFGGLLAVGRFGKKDAHQAMG